MKPPEVLVLWAAGDRADALARTAVGRVLDVDPGEVVIGRRCPTCGSTAHGAPVVEGAWVSLSRTPGHVVAAASTAGPVGVDVERVTDHLFDGFDDVALSASESAALAPGDVRARLRAWVRKEAALKALGLGLRVDPTTFVTPAPGIPTDIVAGMPSVTVVDLDVPRAYAAAVALESGRGALAVRAH